MSEIAYFGISSTGDGLHASSGSLTGEYDLDLDLEEVDANVGIIRNPGLNETSSSLSASSSRVVNIPQSGAASPSEMHSYIGYIDSYDSCASCNAWAAGDRPWGGDGSGQYLALICEASVRGISNQPCGTRRTWLCIPRFQTHRGSPTCPAPTVPCKVALA